jgi:hypothetical protein
VPTLIVLTFTARLSWRAVFFEVFYIVGAIRELPELEFIPEP